MSWDDLIELFNPGHKHLAEERDRKRIEAQLPGSEAADDPRGAAVDLERGIIFLPRAEEPPEDEPSSGGRIGDDGPGAAATDP
ncbi:DUF6191 domain-containing protein [Ornithinimicrobium cerasi]|uniref:DUF6191 domain-containing protein n=1 Tax=Ornithinimicrobium cerasi TaxID=2248773 RepID=UPI000F00B3D8|nr:DUF6191 domain-containing protein [Ornithinimicrobium cerasi]